MREEDNVVSSGASNKNDNDLDWFDFGDVIGTISDQEGRFDGTDDRKDYTSDSETKQELSGLTKELPEKKVTSRADTGYWSKRILDPTVTITSACAEKETKDNFNCK